MVTSCGMRGGVNAIHRSGSGSTSRTTSRIAVTSEGSVSIGTRRFRQAGAGPMSTGRTDPAGWYGSVSVAYSTTSESEAGSGHRDRDERALRSRSGSGYQSVMVSRQLRTGRLPTRAPAAGQPDRSTRDCC